MLGIDIQGPSTDRGVQYYEVTYKIGIQPGTEPTGGDWHRRIANMGYLCLNTSDEQVAATSEGGNRLKKPVALDIDGHYDPANPECSVWYIFATLNETAWGGLGLPATLPT
jgi:hypothetical protein